MRISQLKLWNYEFNMIVDTVKCWLSSRPGNNFPFINVINQLRVCILYENWFFLCNFCLVHHLFLFSFFSFIHPFILNNCSVLVNLSNVTGFLLGWLHFSAVLMLMITAPGAIICLVFQLQDGAVVQRQHIVW